MGELNENKDGLKRKEILFEGKLCYKIGKSADFYEGKGKRILIDDELDSQIAVFRYKGELYALSNICPHRHQDRIFEGYLENGNVVCPAHGWTYSLATGENVNQHQGIKRLSKYNIFEDKGIVYLEKPEFSKAAWKSFNDD